MYSYVTHCADLLIPSKQITVFPNNKPWITKHSKYFFNKKKRVFFWGSATEKKQVNKEVKQLAVRKAKTVYRTKTLSKFADNNLREARMESRTWLLLTQHLR